MKRVSLSLPDELYERLRREASQKKISMGRLIREKLEARPASRARRHKLDPLLQVSGIGNDGRLTQRIDDELYGI